MRLDRPCIVRRLAALAASALALACTAAELPPLMRFQHLTVEQGLPQTSVRAIAQDAAGYLWFGTQGGLARYDGHRTWLYRHDAADPHSLGDDDVHALALDERGTLWVGTQAGLERYDARTDSFTLVQPEAARLPDFSRRYVDRILDDGHGGLWLASYAGLRHVDLASGRFEVHTHRDDDPASLSHDLVRTVARDAQGRLWVGTVAGVDWLAPGGKAFKHLPLPQADNSNARSVTSLLVDRRQVLWVGTQAGLQAWRVDGEPRLWREFGPAEGWSGHSSFDLLEDADGQVWVAIGDHGLLRWDAARERFERHGHDPADADGLPEGVAMALFQDRSRTLWVAVQPSGVSSVDLGSRGFRRLGASPGRSDRLSAGEVMSLLTDPDGTLWVGTSDGLNRVDAHDGRVQHLQPPARPNETRQRRIWSLVRDRAGRLWVGTRGGLFRFDERAGRFVPYDVDRQRSSGQAIRRMTVDRDGVLWLSTYAGLHRFDPTTGAVRSVREQPGGLSSDIVFKTLEDRQGRLWVGTMAGLNRLDRAGGTATHLRHDPADAASLDYDVIYDLHEDARGRLWVLSKQGLNLLEDGGERPRFRRYPIAGNLNSVLEASDGRLWIGTDDGLVSFDPATGTHQRYGRSDGLPRGGFNDACAVRGPDGTLYFGSAGGGVVAFRPAELRHNPQPPPVAITDFRLFNRSVREPDGGDADFWPIRSESLPDRLALTYHHSVFSFEFAALHFADPRGNRFAYRLEGFDRDWQAADAGHRFATYTHLDPGHYVFRVKAASKDGVWNETGASVAVDIAPPYWMTWRFRLGVIALLAALSLAAYRARIRGLLRQQRLLERQVSQRTAEVVRQQSATEEALRDLQRTQQQLVLHEKMASVGTLTAGLAHEINNPANFAHVGAQALQMDLQRFRAFLLALAGDSEPEVAAALNQRIDALVQQLGTIVEGTSRIRDLVRDLRAFSRMEDDERRPVAVADIIESTVRLVQPQYAGVAEIRCELDRQLVVEGWPVQLNQVMMNLLVNACQAIEHKRRARAGSALGLVWVCMRADADWLAIQVQDNGCGMPPAVVHRIFEPFFTTKGVGEGVGLGMSIVFGIVDRHGGELRVNSTEGEGTCITVRLPRSLAADANSQSAPTNMDGAITSASDGAGR